MKKSVLALLLLLVCVLAFSACDGDEPPANSEAPQKLTAPVVTLDGNLASWTADGNADKFEISLDGTLSYVENTVTSKALASGQTLKVRAVGDGASYSTSDWSNSVTYDPAPGGNGGGNAGGGGASGGEPSYLGIFASNSEPSAMNGVPETLSADTLSYSLLSMNSYRSFDEVLKEHFENSDHYLGTTYPSASDYGVYSRAGETVYVQIWLDNPDQHTILSLKLNGTKYQVGGGLSSFFIEEGNKHYNCVYVAVTLPEDAYTEKSYTVTDIEYIADTFINADGTNEFMNQNDTVKIGLPYAAALPSVSGYEQLSLTSNSYSASFDLTDAQGFAALTGGWLGVALYDNYNLLSNQPVTLGNNTVSVTGLVEDTEYRLVIYLFADLHDGGGVRAHYLRVEWINASAAITVDEMDQSAVQNPTKTGYYKAIKVKTTLLSPTAEYIKLEILTEEGEVLYTDTAYGGTATVTEGIRCGHSHLVRVYYKDTEYPEGKYVEHRVYVDQLADPNLTDETVYGFVNDAIYSFKLYNEYESFAAVNGFTVRFYDNEASQYIAEQVLELIANPNLIDELHAYLMQIIRDPDKQAEAHALDDRLSVLRNAENVWNELFERNDDESFWRAEAAKGKYFYEYTYAGTDTEHIFRVGNTYYVLLEDATEIDAVWCEMDVVATLARNDENGAVTKTYEHGGIKFKGLYTEENYGRIEVKDYTLDGDRFTVTLHNNYDSRTDENGERESDKNKCFVYKIEVNGKTVYSREAKTAPTLDEAAWIAEWIADAKDGTLDAPALYDKYVSDYTAETLTLDFSELSAGSYQFLIGVRMYDEVYEEDDCEAWVALYNVEVYKQYGTPTLEREGTYLYVKAPSDATDYYVVLDAKDANGDPLTLERTWDYDKGEYRYDFAYFGATVRVKLSATDPLAGDEGGEPQQSYWTDSDWSPLYTSEAVRLNMPVVTPEGRNTLRFSSDNANLYVEKCVYTVNGGEEREGFSCSYNINQSCTVKVKVVASHTGKLAGYCDSEWTTYHYVYSGSTDKK